MFSARKTAAPSGGYTINNSLRFRSSASAYLQRTPSVAGNNNVFTVSTWLKRGTLGVLQTIFMGGLYNVSNGYKRSQLQFTAADQLEWIEMQTNVGTLGDLITTQVFRDPSAWYHIVCAVDYTQATQANRVKLYVNGVQITAFATNNNAAQNYGSQINTTQPQNWGVDNGGASKSAFFDGYLAESYLIDGQALTPSSFGSTNSTTGVWQPIKYTGTYGTNGFYLNFADNSALTTSSNVGLGKDNSGNGNYWVTNNISITAGSTYDSMTDVPTLTSATAGNYCVMNPISVVGTSTPNGSTSNANLRATTSTVTGSGVTATMALNNSSIGKWYWEVLLVSGVTAAANAVTIGVGENSWADYLGGTLWYYSSSDTPTYTNGDRLGFAFDVSAATLYCYKNNTLAKTITSVSSTTAFIFAGLRDNLSPGSVVADFNFGQQPFTYTPPTGYVAVNTYNLPTASILAGNKYMDATLYTGTGATQSITNAASFKPDFVWVKSRSAATDHKLTDSVRGVTKALISDTTGAETTDTNGLTAFNSNGWSLGTDTNYNNNTATYVGWQWQAGLGSSSSNTNGSITSTVSVNATAGFSIATFTTPASGGPWTIGHGLGVAPKLIIAKSRSATLSWVVYHASTGNTVYTVLNTTGAVSGASSAIWNNTSPSSTVFTMGATSFWGASATYVAYCWAEISGFSNFGSYTGNGSTDGTFVYTGFKPKFVLVKSSSTTDDWRMYDSSRPGYNVIGGTLLADTSGAETTASEIDFTSNGFKLRVATTPNAAQTYIYAAFASNPFKNSNAN